MTTLLEELAHRKEAPRRVQPLSREASAAGFGVFVGILLMLVLCFATKVA